MKWHTLVKVGKLAHVAATLAALLLVAAGQPECADVLLRLGVVAQADLLPK